MNKVQVLNSYSTGDDYVIGIKVNNELEIPKEMFDFLEVLVRAANSGKYPTNNWLKSEGAINSDSKSMHASMFRHCAESSVGHKTDKESGLHPLLHLAARALMFYVRQKRGLE